MLENIDAISICVTLAERSNLFGPTSAMLHTKAQGHQFGSGEIF